MARQYYKGETLSLKLTYVFNALLITPGVLCFSVGVELDKLVTNFKWKENRSKLAKIILRKKN